MIRWGRVWIGALLPLAMIAGTARANETVRIVHSYSSAFTVAFVAADKGYFAAHGLDVSFIATAINPNIPAALVSGSADIGGPTSPVFLQAADGGLDIVAIAGTNLAFPGATNEAAVARVGSGIKTAKDYVGRRVGVPGIGTILDIFFRNWLMINNVDPGKVNFVEISGAQQLDALRAGTVDAEVANDPQLYRMIDSGVGVEAGKIMDVLPGPVPIIVLAVTADYARTHRATIQAFQVAYREGLTYLEAHPDDAKAIMAAHLHLAPDVVKGMELPKFDADVSPAELQVMIDILKRQQQVSKQLDPNALIFR